MRNGPDAARVSRCIIGKATRTCDLNKKWSFFQLVQRWSMQYTIILLWYNQSKFLIITQRICYFFFFELMKNIKKENIIHFHNNCFYIIINFNIYKKVINFKYILYIYILCICNIIIFFINFLKNLITIYNI